MAADGYVTIHRTTDAAQGELLAGTLQSEGIDARFNRVSSALIGVPTLMIEMTIDVPAKSEARARELLRDLEYVGASAAATEEGGPFEPPEGSAPASAAEGADVRHADDAVRGATGRGEARAGGRSPLLAPGFAFVLPGGAHLYARRPWTSLVLALGLCVCFVAGVASASLGVALAIGIVLVLGDAAGGLRAARAESRGVRASRGRQLAAGLGLCGVAVVLGGSTQVLISRGREGQLPKYRVSCTGAGITVENRTDTARAIQLANLRLVARALAGDQSYEIGTIGSGILHLPPAGRGVVRPSIADWLDRACGFGFAAPRPKDSVKLGRVDAAELVEPRASSCELVFDFFARDEHAAESAGLEAYGRCAPPQSAAFDNPGVGTLEARR